MPVYPSCSQMNINQALHWYPKEQRPSLDLLHNSVASFSKQFPMGLEQLYSRSTASRWHTCAYMWSKLDTDHDFAQFVSFGPDVVHEHLIGSELVLDGQRVVLPLLHLLQLDSITQVPHHLNPESSLMGERKGQHEKGEVENNMTL